MVIDLQQEHPMGSIGFPELLIVLIIILLLFGAKKLPDIARSLGEAIKEFKKTNRQQDDETDRDQGQSPHSQE